MNTRTGTATAPTDLPEIDSAALDTAMKAHPVVLDVIERMAATRRGAEAERDKAVADLAAEKTAHRKTKAALEVTQDTNEKLFKSIGTLPTAAAAEPAGLTHAEALAKFDAMTPQEKALVLMKATPARHFDVRGSAPAAEGIFGR